jgi:tetrahydromethanopterin S-methyltransferase subunit B
MTLLIYAVLFIIVIILIARHYRVNFNEGFEDETTIGDTMTTGAITTTTEATTTTEPNTTMPNLLEDDEISPTEPIRSSIQVGQAPANNSIPTLRDINLASVGSLDDGLANTIRAGFREMVNNLDRNANLDVPITLNSEGAICNNWGGYNNGAYRLNRNTCMVVDDTTERKCLSGGGLSSCGYLYQDGYIDSKSVVDITPVVMSSKTGIINSLGVVVNDYKGKNETLDKYIGEIVMKSNLDAQQRTFVDYNIANLDDKQKQVNKTGQELEGVHNTLGSEKISFDQSVENVNNLEYMTGLYYKIVIGMIIVLAVIIILNFAFSNIL